MLVLVAKDPWCFCQCNVCNRDHFAGVMMCIKSFGRLWVDILLWFNLVRVEIRELRPEVIAESKGVLVHYRSRINVQQGLPSKTLA